MSESLGNVYDLEEDTQKEKYLTFLIGDDCFGLEIKYVTEIMGMFSITSVAEHIASSANQVLESSVILSQGVAEQASSVEELTASLEEISAQTNLNAEKAKDPNTISEIAQLNADIGTINLASSEENAASSGELATQSEMLNKLISNYKLL